MDKCINFSGFLGYLFDDKKMVKEAAQIMKALLEAQSPRLTNIAEKMPGQKSESNYKVNQRFLNKVDMKLTLWRLYQEDAEFIIGDPTEMERYKAPKTSYVGTLSYGKTAGYWLMVLSTPFRGRSLPFSFVVYSSRTIGDQCTSRNQEHFRCLAASFKIVLGGTPASGESYWQIGRIWLGKYWEAAYNPAPGVEMGWVQDADRYRSRGGSLRTSSSGARWRTMTMNLAMVSASDRSTLLDMQAQVGLERDVVVSVFPALTGRLERDYVLDAKFTQLDPIAHAYTVHSGRLALEEV